MRFQQIRITGYKNYSSASFLFKEQIIGICGQNGNGKTNLLDAVYYLCFSKSYFTRTENLNIRFGDPGFRLEGWVQDDNHALQHIVCVLREGARKEFSLNDIPYEKFSHHIGRFPCVLIAPDDISLINGRSEDRRKYIDTLISQLDEGYLNQLIIYNKLLAQRNGLLKYEAHRGRRDELLLQSIDDQLIAAGSQIFDSRRDFVKKLFPKILQFYQSIAGVSDTIQVEYDSQLHQSSYQELLRASLEKDFYTQRSNSGVHKDDILFNLEGNPFKAIASQGQKKSLLFACKLAEFELIKEEKGFAPILLLDDIFEKLDESRVSNLLGFICKEADAQVFITDTDATRLRREIENHQATIQIIELE